MDNIEYIWHHTANNGHIKRVFPSNINKDIYTILNKIFKNSIVNNNTTLEFNGNFYLLDTVLDNKGLMSRLSLLENDKEVPFAEIACSDVDYTVYNELKALAKQLNIEHIFGKPKLPYASELLLPAALADKETVTWLPEFTCCLGLMGILGDDF